MEPSLSPEPTNPHVLSVRKWMDEAHASDAEASSVPFDIAQYGQGIASRLYRNCVSCMHHICKNHKRISSSGQGWLALREEMDAFFLWGREFESEELEQALSLLDDLRDSVLKRLVEIGKALQRVRLETIMENSQSKTVFEDSGEAIDLAEQRDTNSEKCPSEWVLPLANLQFPFSNIEIEELTKELQPPIRHLVNLSPIIHQSLEIAALKGPQKALLSSALMPEVSSVFSTAPSSHFKDSGIGRSVWSKSTPSTISPEFESRKSITGRLTSRVRKVPSKGASGGSKQEYSEEEDSGQEDSEQEDSEKDNPISAQNAKTARSRPGAGPSEKYASISAQDAKTARSRPDTGPSLYHCSADGCNYSSTKAYDVKRHMNMHNSVRTYSCPYSWCGRDDDKPFMREDHLTEHLRKVHLRDIPKRAKKSNKTWRERQQEREDKSASATHANDPPTLAYHSPSSSVRSNHTPHPRPPLNLDKQEEDIRKICEADRRRGEQESRGHDRLSREHTRRHPRHANTVHNPASDDEYIEEDEDKEPSYKPNDLDAHGDHFIQDAIRTGEQRAAERRARPDEWRQPFRQY